LSQKEVSTTNAILRASTKRNETAILPGLNTTNPWLRELSTIDFYESARILKCGDVWQGHREKVFEETYETISEGKMIIRARDAFCIQYGIEKSIER